jgi:hypothetical protein
LVDFGSYGEPLDKNWKVNDELEKAEYIGKSKIKGAEAIVFSPDGSMYTGLSNGVLVRIDPDGHIEKIIQIGEEMDERICGMFDLIDFS